jgi:hypothetical protein
VVKPHFLAAMLGPGESTFRIVTPDGRVVARRVEPAFDAATRKRGLLGWTSLDPDVAIVIAPCNAVHTWFMRFPIDIVFVMRDGRVDKPCVGVKPWRVAGSLRAFATVELASGSVRRFGLRPGDHLVVQSASQPIAPSRLPSCPDQN